MEIIRLSKNIEIHPSLNKIVIKNSEDNQSIKVENQLMKLLVLLVSHKGQLVTKEEFIDSIWEGNYPVGEKALKKNIFKLRQLLKKIDAEDKMQIETIPKKGYRLLIQEAKNPTVGIRKPIAIFILILATVLSAIAIFKQQKPSSSNKIEVLEYDENADTIIYLSKDNNVKEINLDSLNGKVIKLND